MRSYINPNLEFYEILNAFPCLKKSLEKLNYSISDVCEGETLLEYFERKSFSDDEIDLFVKKLNSDVNYYFKKGEKCSEEKNNQSEVTQNGSDGLQMLVVENESTLEQEEEEE